MPDLPPLHEEEGVGVRAEAKQASKVHNTL